MNGIDRITERLAGRIKEAQERMENQDPAGAEVILEEIAAEAERVGIRSAHVAWMLAVAHDYQGELEEALEGILKSLALDPLEPSIRNSRDIIVRRVTEALSAAEREAGDPSTPRLYQLLQRTGPVPLGAHLAMARHHLAAGSLPEARRLVEAATLLFPVEPAAWRAKAEVARCAGDEAAARDAEAQAGAVMKEEAPFGTPGVAQA